MILTHIVVREEEGGKGTEEEEKEKEKEEKEEKEGKKRTRGGESQAVEKDFQETKLKLKPIQAKNQDNPQNPFAFSYIFGASLNPPGGGRLRVCWFGIGDR